MKVETRQDAKPTPHPLFDAVKSWKEAHKIANLIRVKVKNVQKNMSATVVETDQIIELLKQLFAVLPKTDGTLFGISPISPSSVMEKLMELAFRSESKELNFSRRLIRRSIIDFSKSFDFSSSIDECLAWCFKREKEDTTVESLV